MVARYAFGTETASFLVCARCGVAPLVTSPIEGANYAVVNVNSFDNLDRARMRAQPASFEGEDVQVAARPSPPQLDRRRDHVGGSIMTSMFAYVCLGSNNLERSATFYDATLGMLGYRAATPPRKANRAGAGG